VNKKEKRLSYKAVLGEAKTKLFFLCFFQSQIKNRLLAGKSTVRFRRKAASLSKLRILHNDKGRSGRYTPHISFNQVVLAKTATRNHDSTDSKAHIQEGTKCVRLSNY